LQDIHNIRIKYNEIEKPLLLSPENQQDSTHFENFVFDQAGKNSFIIEPKALSVFTKGIDRCFEFYKFDTSFHKLLRTTNIIERSFREFRTKTDEIGAFPNESAYKTLFQITINRFYTKNQTIYFLRKLKDTN
jgi:transposase-like protein